MKDGRSAAGYFRALGHPVRLEIMRILFAEGEACVCHLEARLGLRQAYLSQHLARLRLGGLVLDRREGLNVYYRPASAAIRKLLEAGARLETALGAAGDVRQVARASADPGQEPCPCPRCQVAGVRAAKKSTLALEAAG